MWKDIIYNDKKLDGWEINEKGIIRNKITKEIKRSHDNVKGKDLHQRVSIKHKQYYLHKMIAETFIENPNKKKFKVVRHKDDNPLNNSIDNLEWGTHHDNTMDAIKNKKIVYDDHRKYTRNENHPAAILKNKDVFKICKLLTNGKRITDIAKKYNVDRDVILHIYKGNSWKDITKEYLPFPEQHVQEPIPDHDKEKINRYLKKHPNAKAKEICTKLGYEFNIKYKNYVKYQRSKLTGVQRLSKA